MSTYDSSIKSDLQSILNAIDVLSSELDKLSNRLSNIEKSLSRLEKEVQGVRQYAAQIDALQKNIFSVGTLLNALLQSVNSLRQAVDGLSARVDGVESSMRDFVDKSFRNLAVVVHNEVTSASKSVMDKVEESCGRLGKSLEDHAGEMRRAVEEAGGRLESRISQVGGELRSYMEALVVQVGDVGGLSTKVLATLHKELPELRRGVDDARLKIDQLASDTLAVVRGELERQSKFFEEKTKQVETTLNNFKADVKVLLTKAEESRRSEFENFRGDIMGRFDKFENRLVRTTSDVELAVGLLEGLRSDVAGALSTVIGTLDLYLASEFIKGSRLKHGV